MAKGRDAEPVKGRTARPAGKARGRRGEDPGAARVLQMRQFVIHVAARAGMRSAQVKDIVEATLAELGEAIASGQTLALPPLGRARINRQRDVSGAEVIVLRLRRRQRDLAEGIEDDDD